MKLRGRTIPGAVMRGAVLICGLIGLFVVGEARADYELEVLARFDFPYTFSGGDTTGGSDCWGYVAPDGHEYAIMGVFEGYAIVSVTDSVIVTTVPGPTGGCSYYWRDMAVYRNYLYCVSECVGTNQGLLVVDLSPLPDSVHVIGAFSVNGATSVTSHNLSIDSIQGYVYLEGNSSSQKVRIHSIADPENPVFVGGFNPGGFGSIHDIYAMNDTLYVAEGSSPFFSIWNMANKSNPAQLARVGIPNPGYVHNIWPSDNRNYAVTTEETAFKTVKVWDISDLGNINLVGQYLGFSNLAHNAHVMGDSMICMSHYEWGVSVVDMSDPANPVELDNFDTYKFGNSADFYGCWGAYPYGPNGHIYGSDIEGHLTVLQLNWVAPPPPPCDCDLFGEITGDNHLNIIDITALIDYVFRAGPPPPATPDICPSDEKADVNCDGQTNVLDVIYYIDFSFRSGPWPCEPCDCVSYPENCP